MKIVRNHQYTDFTFFVNFLNQSVKTKSGEFGKILFNVLTNNKLGGVPIRVPVPPILAA